MRVRENIGGQTPIVLLFKSDIHHINRHPIAIAKLYANCLTGAITALAMIALTGNSILCRMALNDTGIDAVRDALHNSLRSVISRTRAVCRVVFIANSRAIGCKKTPCSPSRSDCDSLARVMQSIPSFTSIRLVSRSDALGDHDFLLLQSKRKGQLIFKTMGAQTQLFGYQSDLAIAI